MLLRPMRAADLAGLGEVHELRRLALAGAAGSGPTDDRDRAVWQHIARHVLGTDPAGCWSAEDDTGAFVGGVLSLRREGLWVVSTLAVLPYAARLGAGRLLLERAGAHGAAALRAAVCLSTAAEVADAGLYRAYGLRVHPTVRLGGAVERSGLPVVAGVREGVREAGAAGAGLPDGVDWLVRGAPRGADLAVLAHGGTVLVAETSSGRGYACLRPGSVTALSATDVPTARALLWEALARCEGEVALERVTAEQDWAVEVAVRAGLTVQSAGAVCLRGMRPPVGHLPSARLF